MRTEADRRRRTTSRRSVTQTISQSAAALVLRGEDDASAIGSLTQRLREREAGKEVARR